VQQKTFYELKWEMKENIKAGQQNSFIQFTTTAIREAFASSQHSCKEQHPLLPSNGPNKPGQRNVGQRLSRALHG
jgi:hypothetical protein